MRIIASYQFYLKNLTIALKKINEKFIILMGKQLVYLPNQNYALYPDVVMLNRPPQYFDYDETLSITLF